MASTRTTVTLDQVLADQARRLNINISAAAREGVEAAVRAAMARADRAAYLRQPEQPDPFAALKSDPAGAIVVEHVPAGEFAAGLCGLAAGPVVWLERSPLEQAVCVVYEKIAPTPGRFPRREGIAAKRPLAT